MFDTCLRLQSLNSHDPVLGKRYVTPEDIPAGSIIVVHVSGGIISLAIEPTPPEVVDITDDHPDLHHLDDSRSNHAQKA